jgi:hypothetical protein
MKGDLITYINVGLCRTTLLQVSKERAKDVILTIGEVPLEDEIPLDIPGRTPIYARDPRVAVYVSDAYLATIELISAKRNVITCLLGEERISFVYISPGIRKAEYTGYLNLCRNSRKVAGDFNARHPSWDPRARTHWGSGSRTGQRRRNWY